MRIKLQYFDYDYYVRIDFIVEVKWKKREIFVNICGIKFCLSIRYIYNYIDMYYWQVYWGGSILIKNDLNYEFFFFLKLFYDL